jgi:hypothetical protein
VSSKTEMPEWLPLEQWDEYLAMRKGIKKPLTEYGKKLAIRQLEKLKAVGHDPAAVLDQSIMMSYQGLFPVKQIAGLEPAVEKRALPGQCGVCGGGKRRTDRGWECKKCGRVTPEREE